MEWFLAKGLLREVRAKGRPLGAGALMVEESSVVKWRRVRQRYVPNIV